MTKDEAINSVINLVPQWTYDRLNDNPYLVTLQDASKNFYSHRYLTPDLEFLYNSINTELNEIFLMINNISNSTGIEVIQEHFVLLFLNHIQSSINWKKIIDYEKYISKRTYENEPISFNISITASSGTYDITDESIQKYLDPLTVSNWSYINVDHNMQFVKYNSLPWTEITEPDEYKFYPDFLQPYMNVNVENSSYSIHKTRRGDFIILNSSGLLAAKRKGQWKIYNPYTLKNSITDIIGHYRIGANLFEILFDLSFKRHGALLIFDKNNVISSNIVNQESILSLASIANPARMIIKSAATQIKIGDPRRMNWNKSVLLDLASIDGAVVFNENEIIAVGALIKSQNSIPGVIGARSTAAYSAMKYGASACKISADGQISIYYKARGHSIETKLEFF